MREDRGRNSRARQGAGKRSRAKIATGNRGNSAEPSRRIQQARMLRGSRRTCARKSPEPVTLTFSAGTSTLSACPEIASQSPETESPFRACVFNEDRAPHLWGRRRFLSTVTAFYDTANCFPRERGLERRPHLPQKENAPAPARP